MPVDDDGWFPFGGDGTATYGQSFTVDPGDTSLSSFSLWLGRPYGVGGPLDFKGYLGTWTGTSVGSILYTSDVRTHNGVLSEYVFNTGGVAITPGDQYIAFLSVSDLPAQSSTFFMPYANVELPGVYFNYYNNGTDFAALTSKTWDARGYYPVAFKASFGALGAVPEPATWATMLLGMFGVAGAMRSRKVKTTVSFA